MEKNKTGKYFKYAIGEIILVVIGILIALSINNWNEDKKNRVYELKMLKEINNALEYDIEHYYRMEKRLHKLDSASTQFINYIHAKKEVFNDTLYRSGFSRWYYLRTGILYQYNPGPYEALKSSGLDKLSNNSLRNTLINFYDFRFPFTKEMILYAGKDYDKDIAKLESFLGNPFTEMVDGKVEIYQKFPENLFQNIEFLELLRNMRARAQITTRHINIHSPQMIQVSELIKTEIEQ